MGTKVLYESFWKLIDNATIETKYFFWMPTCVKGCSSLVFNQIAGLVSTDQSEAEAQKQSARTSLMFTVMYEYKVRYG